MIYSIFIPALLIVQARIRCQLRATSVRLLTHTHTHTHTHTQARIRCQQRVTCVCLPAYIKSLITMGLSLRPHTLVA